MGVEGGYSPQNDKDVQREKPRPGFSVESIKKGFEQTRQTKGERYYALELGLEHYQATKFAKNEKSPGFFTAQQQVIETLLPEIRSNPELNEIYSTTYQLHAEQQRLFDELFNKGQLSEEDWKKKAEENSRLDKIWWAYLSQIKVSSKPASTPEQQEPPPRLCIDAVKYQVRDETVPETHTHSCPICSSQTK